MKKKRHSKDLINSVKLRRQQGSTIEELMVLFHLPKTTVWHHIRGVELSEEISKALRSRKGGSHKRREKAILRAQEVAKELLCSENRELVIAVTMLYWAEGHKNAFIFTNTDVTMLRLYLRFLYKVFEISKKEVYVMVRTSDPISPSESIAFWSKKLDLPEYLISNNHNNIQNKTKTKFGICRVMVAKSSFYHKVMTSLIWHVQEDLLAPVVQRIELRTPNAGI